MGAMAFDTMTAGTWTWPGRTPSGERLQVATAEYVGQVWAAGVLSAGHECGGHAGETTGSLGVAALIAIGTAELEAFKGVSCLFLAR